MREIDSFKDVFQYTPTENVSVISVHETSGQAKIRHLHVVGLGKHFALFCEKCSVMAGSLFKKSSHCTKNADGTIFFEDSGMKCMLLCELKSSGGGVFKSAYQQTFSTYLKMCMMMSICEGFDISNYQLYFLFTAQDGAELAVRRNEIEQIEESERNDEDKIRLRLLKGESVKLRMNSVPVNMSFLDTNLVCKDVVCKLVTSPTDRIVVDVSQL